MLPLFSCCTDSSSAGDALRRHQERKLRMLRFWRDGAERQVAALEAAIPNHDAVLVSDYSKGVCTPRTLAAAIEIARRHHLRHLVGQRRRGR